MTAVVPTFGTIPPGILRRKCACGGSAGLTGECPKCQSNRLMGKPLQGKLRVNEPGDEYEREADRVSEQVMIEASHQGDSSPLDPGPIVQRRVDGSDTTNVQRQERAPEQHASEGVQQTDGGDKEEGSRCPSWRADPESISKRAAETYVQNDMTPPSKATVKKINCEPPIANGNYGCYVHFSDGLVIRVIVREKDIVVGTGPGPFTTLTPPPGTPLCFYDYHCPEGLLVLTKRECKSAKPAASSGPTLVGQRRAAPGASGALDSGPAVGRVLDTAGQPLDTATLSFFGARFGHDFAHVRVHADAQAAESAHSVSALSYTVGSHVVFGTGQFSPGTRAGQKLLAHELAHVVQQTGRSASSARVPTEHGDGDTAPTANIPRPSHPMRSGLMQRQPEPESKFRDLPIFLEKLEFDVGKNLEDYGHHLYQAATLHPDEPDVLKEAFSRYALGKNVLQTTFKFAGFKPDTANKLALGTGILFKSLTFVREGELTLDFQIDLGRGLKFETNLNLGVDPKDKTEVRKAGVNFGLVRRF
jgi:hypothetical protein